MTHLQKQIETRLAQQAEEIVPLTAAPTAELLGLHAKRMRRIRRNRTLVALLMFPLLSFAANRVLKKSPTESIPAMIAQDTSCSAWTQGQQCRT